MAPKRLLTLWAHCHYDAMAVCTMIPDGKLCMATDGSGLVRVESEGYFCGRRRYRGAAVGGADLPAHSLRLCYLR
jgi:hypothetical protein